MAALDRIKPALAKEICQQYAPSPGSSALLKDDAAPEVFLKALLDNSQFDDAVQFLAHALPPQDAIWWACLCLGQAAGKKLGFVESVVLRKVVGWLRKSDEVHRRAVAGPAQGIVEHNPASAIARAVLATPTPPKGKPPAAVLASQAILQAADLAEAKIRDVPLCQFLALGIGIAKGKHSCQS